MAARALLAIARALRALACLCRDAADRMQHRGRG